MFSSLDGKPIQVNQLNLSHGDFQSYSNEILTLYDIPLGKKQFYLTLILPERIDEMNDIIDLLTPKYFESLMSKTSPLNHEILLPPIRIDSEVRLKDLFPQFGLTGPIEIIEGFHPLNNLFISDFIHKTSFLIGNESEPDNSSIVELGSVATMSPLMIDRPFIFLVREKYTGAIIFTGKLVNPD